MEREGVVAMGRLPWGGTATPQPSFLGPWAGPSPPQPTVVSSLAPGTYRSFLDPAWPGRVPAADSLSHSCHFSSVALFPLSASYTLQRLHRKAWLPLRRLLRPLTAQVSCWPELTAQSGPPTPVSESRPSARVAECRVRGLFGYLGSWCLRLWAWAPAFQLW